MSNSENFIAEVAEDVRREKLYALMRRYGWILGLLIVIVVAGTAWREYSNARAQAAAAERGSALLDAFEIEDVAERAAVLNAAAEDEATGGVIARFLAASQSAEAGDIATAMQHYDVIGASPDVDVIYRDLALFKGALLGDDLAQSQETLLDLAIPGRPLRVLAQEQLALIEVSNGDTEAALERLQEVLIDAEASNELRLRVTQLITVLGGTPNQGSMSQGDGTNN